MARNQAFARTVPAVDGGCLPPDRWQSLEEHLTAVAERAAEFARSLDASEWARLAGIRHDLGKYHPSFQAMLYEVAEGKPKRRVDHAAAGASTGAVHRALTWSLSAGGWRLRTGMSLLS